MVAGHQEATRELWAEFGVTYDGYVSALVYEEAGRGDPVQARMRLAALKPFRILDIDEEAKTLAEKLVAGRSIPEEYPEDALHIAIAAINGLDIIVTWNFAHMNNPFTRVTVRTIIEEQGYLCPEICSPDELLEIDK